MEAWSYSLKPAKKTPGWGVTGQKRCPLGLLRQQIGRTPIAKCRLCCMAGSRSLYYYSNSKGVDLDLFASPQSYPASRLTGQ